MFQFAGIDLTSSGDALDEKEHAPSCPLYAPPLLARTAGLVGAPGVSCAPGGCRHTNASLQRLIDMGRQMHELLIDVESCIDPLDLDRTAAECQCARELPFLRMLFQVLAEIFTGR